MNIVEKVARAIAAHSADCEYTEQQWLAAVDLAHIAIEEIRDMVKCTKGGNRDDDIRLNAMIDAALKE